MRFLREYAGFSCRQPVAVAEALFSGLSEAYSQRDYDRIAHLLLGLHSELIHAYYGNNGNRDSHLFSETREGVRVYACRKVLEDKEIGGCPGRGRGSRERGSDLAMPQGIGGAGARVTMGGMG